MAIPRTIRTLSAAIILGSQYWLCAIPAWSATQERPDADMRTALFEAINSSESFTDRFDAEVWLTDMSHRLQGRVKDPEERLMILKQVHYEARRSGLEPELVLALINVESNFDHFAISSVGARGLMQIMPFWLEEIGRPDDNLFDISTNLRFGCTILISISSAKRVTCAAPSPATMAALARTGIHSGSTRRCVQRGTSCRTMN